MVDIRSHGAVAGGVVDCTTAINDACAYAINNGAAVLIPEGVWRTTASVVWDGPQPRITGVGPGGFGYTYGSILAPDNATFNALVLGDGTGDGVGGGYCTNLAVRGPSVRPTKTSKAAILIDAAKFCRVENCSVENHDIGYRLLNNCFGSSFLNCQAMYSACNVGLDLPSGFNTGSDLCFFDCWLSGGTAAVHVGGGSGGYHFIGGQLRAAPGTGTPVGVVVLAKDYDTAAVAAMGIIDFHGVDFENWEVCHAFRGYAPVQSLGVSQSSFLATATGARKAVGIGNFVDPGNAQLQFHGNAISGDYTAASLLEYSNLIYDAFGLYEDGWATVQPCTVNSVTLAWLHSLADQRGTESYKRGHGLYTQTGVYPTFQVGSLKILSVPVVPSAGAGIQAPLGAAAHHESGTWYRKTGAGATAWTEWPV